jgi:hemerythrin-like domain-containing protein
MCEYCGCQDVEAIADLTAEHDRLRDLGRELEAAADAADLPAARPLAAAMCAVLAPHTAVEEQALFPAMAGEYAEHVDRLVGEHRTIDAVLAPVADGVDVPDWPQRVQAALDALFEHILKEQDGVFPAALATLTPDQWETLDDVRRRVGTGLARRP